MKFLTVVVISLAVASGFSQPLNEVQSNGRVKDLIDAALVYARSQSKEDPIILPEFGQSESRVRISNGTLSGLSQLVVDREATNEKAMTATFRATIPEVTLQFDYHLRDSIYGRPILGDGHFKLVVTNISFDAHDIAFGESHNNGFKVTDMDADYYVDDLSVEMGDLIVNGETASDVGKLIETLFHFFYHLERKDFSQSMSDGVRHQLNDLLYGRSMEEATQWLKNHTK